MQGDRQTYEHVVPEGMGLEAFCAREVETMGIEADEPQVRALTLTLTTDPNPSPSLNPNPNPNPNPSPNPNPGLTLTLALTRHNPIKLGLSAAAVFLPR